ncbi:MAG: hypothetical protein VX672_02525, partial [Planctomycetota bacterium]|nr:hypothetical protein [Planctomycetota bacterium]
PAPGAALAGLAGLAGAAGAATASTNFSTRKASQVRESLSRFGNATPDHLAYARSLIASIPETIRDAAHDVIGARAICLILLVSADEDVRKIQSDLLESSLDEPTRHEVSRLSKPTRTLLRDSPESRLVLLDLLMPALVRMSPENSASYSKILTGMMDADGSRDRFEWLMGRLIQSHFDSHTTKQRGRNAANRRIGDLEAEVRLVLAMIAWSSGRDRTTAERSFRVSARAVDVGDADFPDRADCSVAKLDDALDRLQRLRYRDRPRLLDAAVEGIFSDGHATIDEVELLRALAATLSCPMPPVLPG